MQQQKMAARQKKNKVPFVAFSAVWKAAKHKDEATASSSDATFTENVPQSSSVKQNIFEN